MVMILATSITEPYLEKSELFFSSAVKHFKGVRICFCIGFKTKIPGWKCVEVPLPLACNWQPTNRVDYGCLQHGEFVKYYRFKDSDIVLFTDSDMVLQRDFDFNYTGGFCVTNSSFPPTKLTEVSSNIGGPGYVNDKNEFCTGFIIASVKLWKELYKEVYKNIMFLNHYNHHAAWQLLINIIVADRFKYIVLPPVYCCADWYTGTQASGRPLMVDDEVVYFNHTKFN